MRNLLKLVLHLVLVAALNLISAALPLAEAVDAPTKTDAPLFPGISHTPGLADLGQIQTEQDSIKQQASTASSSKQLDMLTIATQQLAGDVKKLTAPLLSERAQLGRRRGIGSNLPSHERIRAMTMPTMSPVMRLPTMMAPTIVPNVMGL